jgi:GNAT superfamily N-acetyltransferase
VGVSYEDVAADELAAVVTFLEMREPPLVQVLPSPLRLSRVGHPEHEAYRQLFRLVGAPWLWFSRLAMSDRKLAEITQDPKVELFEVIDEADHIAGMLELDFRQHGECELAFIGLVPELAGQGHGRWLLAEAVSRAWREGVTRVHVHTCSLDHPAALSAYRQAGFTPYKRAIERFPDPRLLGILPKDCAPHIPLIG